MSNIDTSELIFKRRFFVSYDDSKSKSFEYIKLFGTPTTGDPSVDNALRNQRIDSFLTINEMIELYKMGVTIGVKKYADCKVIYTYIEQHLLAWKNKLENGFNVKDAPFDDLIVMNEFATTVWKYTRHILSQEDITQLGGLAYEMRKRNLVNVRDVIQKAGLPKPEKKEEKQLPQREGYASFFKTKSVTRNGPASSNGFNK